METGLNLLKATLGSVCPKNGDRDALKALIHYLFLPYFIFSSHRGRSRVVSSPNARTQGSYPAPRPLSALGPNLGDDTLIQAIMNLDRG